MSKLPNSTESVSLLKAKQEATDTVTELLEQNLEMREIYNALQPLLYALSVALYGEDASDISLQKLVEDSVKMLTERGGQTLQ